MDYLLDTNICIYLIKRKPHQVFDRFRSLSVGALGISSITEAELLYGAEKSRQSEKNRLALAHFLLPIEIVTFGSAAAHEYSVIRSDLEKAGNVIGPLDMLIAAQAKSIGTTLITNNEHEFLRVKGLKVENWV